MNDGYTGAGAAALALIEQHAPNFAATARRVYTMATNERALSAREVAIIEMVVYGNVSYYDPAELRRAMRSALDSGGSDAELTTVIALTSAVGLHGLGVSMPILFDALEARDDSYDKVDVSDAVRAHIEDRRGSNSKASVSMMIARIDPEFAVVEADWIHDIWTTDLIDLKLRELIYVAFNATSTHMFLPGLAVHIGRALDAGATPSEIVQTLEITTVPSLDLVARSLAHLRELAAERRD